MVCNRGGGGRGIYFDFRMVRGDAEADEAVGRGEGLVHVDEGLGEELQQPVRGVEAGGAGADDGDAGRDGAPGAPGGGRVGAVCADASV